MVEIEGPVELERLPRYVRSRDKTLAIVRRTLTEGGKVLWVSNTVGRCMAVATETAGMPARPTVYHSRFRYRDRIRRHDDVVQMFLANGPTLATATQVAEMSLDLSADLLVTDLAPVPALIQRLGRLNRRSSPERAEPPKPFVVLPFQGDPYDGKALEAAERWLASLGDGPLSQRDLVSAWAPEEDAVETVASTWLDGGFVTEIGDLREATPGLTVLLAEDAARVRRGDLNPVEAALPMGPPPRRLRWKEWECVAWLPVAPTDAVAYDSSLGGRWLVE
jgi:CRISPR-associated endonuclease/helicase Cas3